MNFYLFDRPTYSRLYNCSMLPAQEWEKRKNPNLIGVFYMLLAAVYQVVSLFLSDFCASFLDPLHTIPNRHAEEKFLSTLLLQTYVLNGCY